MRRHRSTPVVEDLAYPECPRWHDGVLWFSDQYAELVHTWGREGLRTRLRVPGRPAGLGWLPDGSLLVVSMERREVQRWVGDALTTYADLTAVSPGPSNELLVDGAGRAYVGNIGFDFYGGEQPRTTSIVLVETDGSLRVVADDVLVPNGMALIEGGATLVLAESFAGRLTAFDVAPDGGLSGRRLFADLGEATIPDGICADAEDGIWFASVGTATAVRVDRGGRVTDVVETGDRDVFACELGGPDGRTLHLCTSRSHEPAEASAIRSGAIETARVEVPGPAASAG